MTNTQNLIWLFLLTPLFGSGQFGLEQRILANPIPAQIEVADINMDGFNDILFSSSSVQDGGVYWLENNNGAFSDHKSIDPYIGSSVSLSIADLNDDAIPDILALSDQDSKLYWMQNNGEEDFSSAQIIGSVSHPSYVTAADLDGDGDLDPVFTSVANHRIGWFRNLGDGNFSGLNLVAEPWSGSYQIGVADMDNDGLLDIVSAEKGWDVEWYKNLGDGEFDNGHHVYGDWEECTSIAVADIDSDGDPDIVASSTEDNALAWFENQESGQAYIIHPLSNSIEEIHQFDIADLDNDGDLDVTCTLTENHALMQFINDNNEFEQNSIAIENENSTLVKLDDFDNDGEMDVAYASLTNNSIAVLTNQSNDYSTEIQVFKTSFLGCPKLLDINFDGQLDIVVTESSSVLWFNKVNETWVKHVLIEDQNPAHGALITTRVFDLDADGDYDVIFGYSNVDGLFWVENLGGLSFSQPTLLLSSNYSAVYHPCDIDNDSKVDLIVSEPFGNAQLGWRKNMGDLQFGQFQLLHEEVYGPMDIETNDLDQNGYQDLIISCWTEQMTVIMNQGSGIFSPPQELTYTHIEGGGSALGVADMNLDGTTDLVSAGYHNEEVVWFSNQGQDNYSGELLIDQSTNDHEIATCHDLFCADLDMDGYPDVITARSNSGELAWYRNLGDGNFSESLLIDDLFHYPKTLNPADLDNDGDFDLIAVSYYYDRISWYENILVSGCTNAEACNYDPYANFDIGSCVFVLNCGDVNGDGETTLQDLLQFIGDYGCIGDCPGDLNEDGVVNVSDLLLLMGLLG